MTADMKLYGSPLGQVLAPVVRAFGEMSSEMYGLADVIAAAMTEDHLQFFKGSAKEIRGMFRQRVLRDWGHAAHLGWARLLHDRRRDQHDEREFYANHFYQNREQFPARH